jgi:hypothetical protein
LPALGAALRSLRLRHQVATESSEASPIWIAQRAGMRLTASLSRTGAAAAPSERTVEMRAVAAIAASVMLPRLATADAARLAEAEGLVTHLTSLVLVDEVGAAQEGLPASRKVPLAAPRTQAVAAMAPASVREKAEYPLCIDSSLGWDEDDRALSEYLGAAGRGEDEARSRAGARRARSSAAPAAPVGSAPPIQREMGAFPQGLLELSGADLLRIFGSHNWDFEPNRLLAADLAGLSPAVRQAICKAAARSEVVALADKLGLSPIVLVIALMAHAVAKQNRSASRLARAILPGALTKEQKTVARGLGFA